MSSGGHSLYKMSIFMSELIVSLHNLLSIESGGHPLYKMSIFKPTCNDCFLHLFSIKSGGHSLYKMSINLGLPLLIVILHLVGIESGGHSLYKMSIFKFTCIYHWKRWTLAIQNVHIKAFLY